MICSENHFAASLGAQVALRRATTGLMYATCPRVDSAYVIGSDEIAGRIKIGVSCDPERRLSTLQCGSPVRLELRHVEPIPAGMPAPFVETKAHDLLEGSRLHGEWFDAASEQGVAAIWWALDSSEYLRRPAPPNPWEDLQRRLSGLFAGAHRPRLGPPAISSGPDDDLGDLE
jgi:hypothetical protein